MIKQKLRDHSKATKANPTKTLLEHYQELMSLDQADELVENAVRLVREHGGVSDRNRLRFETTLRALAGNLDRLRAYITNFVLAGSGDQVLNVGARA